MMKVTHPQSSMRSEVIASTPQVIIGKRHDARSGDLCGGSRKASLEHALSYVLVILNLLAAQTTPAAVASNYTQALQLAQ